MRTVTVIGTTLSVPKEYNTEATTWGQLKDLVSRDFGDISGMKAVCKENRNTLDRDDAMLPDDDCTIFLSSAKIKAGGIDIVELLEALKNEYINTIDNVLEQIANGDFDVSSSNENAIAVSSKPQVNGISREDAEFLATM